MHLQDRSLIMTTATKNSAVFLTGEFGVYSNVFKTDINLVETEDSYQEDVIFFRDEITKALKDDGFYSFTYPTPQVNSLDRQDIIDAIFNTDRLKKMHFELMTVKNEFDVIPRRRVLVEAAIDELANEWSTHEASSAPKKLTNSKG